MHVHILVVQGKVFAANALNTIVKIMDYLHAFFQQKQKKRLIDPLKNLLKTILDMRINVKAKPNSKEEKVYPVKCHEVAISPSEKLFNGVKKIDACYEVWVKEPPIKGRANVAIRNALAIYFKTASSRVKIISGYSSRNKIIEIE